MFKPQVEKVTEYTVMLPGEIPLEIVRIWHSGGALDAGKYVVTQEQWEAVMGSNPSDTKGPKLPVTNVSWYDAHEFCKKLEELTGVRFTLPTEEEWEFAARAGTDYEYAGSNNPDEVAWHAGNSGNRIHEVGELKPNAWGLYDMSGNVWEWTDSEYK